MKYSITINQEAAIRLNLNIDYLDLSIFDCVANILNCPEFPSLLIPSTGRTFKWISTKLILKELPLLGLKERAIRMRLEKLEAAELLTKYIDTRDGNKPYYAQGGKFSAMFRTDADPRNLDADPRNLDADPRNLDADPRNLDADIDNITNNNTNDCTMYENGAKTEFSPEPARTEKRRFSKENGLTPGNLNVRQSTIDKIDVAFEQLVFPIDDAEIKKLFFVLCCSPKWRGKTVHALQMSLNKVQNYDRDFTIKLIEDSIAGGWQGLVFENTDRKYQDYLKAKKGGISWGGGTTFTKMSDEERKEALEYLNL